MLIEESDSISSLVAEDYDPEKILDETDFLDYFESGYNWLNLLENLRLLKIINDPENNIGVNPFGVSYAGGYLKEPAELPYILRVLKKEDEELSTKESDSTSEIEPLSIESAIHEKKVA
ncbi:hypothetical protein KY343_01215 [Candidatus Woesearchaeota archaeon]|nr:hypothetical protein [Candidatus Woesearchaeota archaeon]